MHIKVDQSGKMEVLTVDTVLAFSNEITATLLIPVSVKRETYQTIALATYRGKRKPDKKATGGELLRFC